MNIATDQEQRPSEKVQSNISSRITAEKYTLLSRDESHVLHMLDSLAPSSESTSWPCSYDELINMADVSPTIESGEVMKAITRLRDFKMLDFFYARDGDLFNIWVAPWTYRHQLAHELNTQLIARRSTSASTTSSGEPTQAA